MAGDTVGSSFNQSIARLQGTVLGAMVGYVGLQAFQDTPGQWGIGVLLALWTGVVGIARQSAQYVAPSVVASFTAAVILFSS